MQLLVDYTELRRVLDVGDGVVLVDRGEVTQKRSILHAATCAWAQKIGRTTPVRFAPTHAAAAAWLRRDGRRWRPCPDCGGRERASEPRLKERATPTAAVDDRDPEGEIPTRAGDRPVQRLQDEQTGSPSRYAQAMDFVRRYERMAAAARGLSGVLAASVELHPHQLRVVRRVLDDSFQRYLLADEVGLGKTIEAGLILRQRLLDAPRSIAVVFCPEALTWQWREELDQRLGLLDFRPSGMEVVAYDADPRAFERITTPDIIVIDEAHRIASGWASPEPETRRLFWKVAELAWSTPRLLLVSATPVLHHERTMLAMLHLLDPDTFALNDKAAKAFERQVGERERLGGIFARLGGALPTFVRRRALKELEEALPDDPRLNGLLAETLAALDKPEEDPGEAAAALEAVRVHMSETYRLHRRILRTRREHAAETTYRVRGRQGLETIDDPDPRRGEAEAWLTRWRNALEEEAENDARRKDVAVAVLAMFVERASGALGAMAALARWKLKRHDTDRRAAGLTSDERRILGRDLWDSTELRALLEKLVDVLADDGADDETDPWVRNVADALSGTEGKSVVFASAEPTAVLVAHGLESRFGASSVALFTAGIDSLERHAAATRLQRDPRCRVLVCDRSGEEGLNLQEAGTVVHVDLPLATSRVEQRIGRLDRRSDGPPVKSFVLAPLPGGFVEVWLDGLRDGFGVFSRSSAPMQYAVERVERNFKSALMDNGPAGSRRLIEQLAASVDEEQKRIDRIDGLDALAGEVTDEADLISAYESAEAHGEQLAESLRTVVMCSGREIGVVARPKRAEHLQLAVVTATPTARQFPGLQQHESCLVVDRALALEETSARLVRPGTPAVDLIRKLLSEDDRALTFAVWRHVPDDQATVVAFCWDLLVRADVEQPFQEWRRHESQQPSHARAHRSNADAPLDRAAFQRRADAHLSPTVIRLWTDSSGREFEDPRTLEAAIDDASTNRWSKAAWRRAEVLANVDDLGAEIERIAEAARAQACKKASRLADPAGASRAMSAEADRSLLQLELRAHRDRSSAARAELEAMRSILPTLANAISNPSAEVLGAGIVVETPEPVPSA